jgi:hypothetical protein
LLHLLTSGFGRFCCKSLFALVIKNFPGFRRDFRVKMWGTPSLVDKLPDDLGTAIDGTRITGRRSDFFTAGKMAPANLGLLQQYRHYSVMSIYGVMSAARGSGHKGLDGDFRS